ncbi:hypothetical protein NUSPORA_02098 [Nucleospora cyclopteri]
MTKKSLKKEIIRIFKEKKQFFPSTKINLFAMEHKLEEGKRIRKQELEDFAGTALKLKFRMGNVLTNKDLTRWKKTPENKIGHCISCNKKVDESYLHILIDCKGTEELREKYLRKEIAWFRKKSPHKYKRLFVMWLLSSSKAPQPNTENSNQNKSSFWKNLDLVRKYQIKKFLRETNM